MRKVIVFNKNRGPVFRDSFQYFRSKNVPIASSFEELYQTVEKLHEPVDIYILAHGFTGDDELDVVEGLRNIVAKTPIKTIVRRLEESSDGQIVNLVILACYSTNELDESTNIQQMVLYKKFIHSDNVLKLSKLIHSTLPYLNAKSGYNEFMEALEGNSELLDLEAFRRYR